MLKDLQKLQALEQCKVGPHSCKGYNAAMTPQEIVIRVIAVVGSYVLVAGNLRFQKSQLTGLRASLNPPGDPKALSLRTYRIEIMTWNPSRMSFRVQLDFSSHSSCFDGSLVAGCVLLS